MRKLYLITFRSVLFNELKQSKPPLTFLTEGSSITWRTCAPRSVGSSTLAPIATVKIFTDFKIQRYYKWVRTISAKYFQLVYPLGHMLSFGASLVLTEQTSLWFIWSTVYTFAFLAAAILDERDLCFFAFLSWGTGIEITVYFLGKQFAALDDLFHFVKALQARGWKKWRTKQCLFLVFMWRHHFPKPKKHRSLWSSGYICYKTLQNLGVLQRLSPTGFLIMY